MVRKTLLALLMTWVALQWRPAAGADELPPASQWLPQNSILAVEIAKPKPVLDLLLGPKSLAAVTATPAYQQAASEPKLQQFIAVVRYLEARLGTDWKAGLHALLDGGVCWAVTPDGGSLVIVDAQDAKLLGRLHEILLEFAKGEAAKQGTPERVAQADYRGVTGWTFGPNEAHAIVGNRLLLANRPEVLKAALDRRAQPQGGSLAAAPNYLAARRALGGEAAATAYLDLASLKKHPQIQQALAENANPLASLLTSGLSEALRHSNTLAMKLRVEGQDLTLQAVCDGKADAASPTAFAWPTLPEEGALPNLEVPRLIAAMSFYRDLHAFYAAKDKLFPERTSGLIFFENMMGIFFSGRELTQDVLAQPKPHVRFVVAEQQYDPAVGKPQIQIPAMAAVFRLRNPKQYAEVVEAAWQKAIGLVSITRGQKAELGMIVDRDNYRDTRYSVAYFPLDKEEKGPLGTQFNFRPALVKLDEYLVISSTEQLAKDLIDALKQEAAAGAKPLPGTHSLVVFDAAQLASVLAANREPLVRQNMVEKGNSREQAEREVGLLTALLKYLGKATLSMGATPAGQQATLQLKLNLP